MAKRLQLINQAKSVLFERHFSERQVEKLVPRLHEELIKQPKFLAEIIDTWNTLMGSTKQDFNAESDYSNVIETIRPLAIPPRKSLLGRDSNINMTHILADVEPDLLLLEPSKLIARHERIRGLGIALDTGQMWSLLFNAPRGFYLQDWTELMKKIFYMEHKVIDLLYEKKDLKVMERHPILKAAATVESDFDHIRTRYLFAFRCGYKALSHIYPVQTALTQPTLKDLILVSDAEYLRKFAPFCSEEEYSCFSNLIKNTDYDDEDAEVFSKYAELETLKIAAPQNHRLPPIMTD